MVSTHARSPLRPGEATLIACLLAFAVPFASFAQAVRVAPHCPTHADTEASTNILLWADAGCAREFEIAFSLPAESASNCIQVAFGRDVDGDGALGHEEAETLFGWRGGRYFAEGKLNGVRVEEAAPTSATSRLFAASIRLSAMRGFRRVAATNETGSAVFTTLPAVTRSWLHSPGWNMMRVTRRGPGAPGEWFSCDVRAHPMSIILR